MKVIHVPTLFRLEELVQLVPQLGEPGVDPRLEMVESAIGFTFLVSHA